MLNFQAHNERSSSHEACHSAATSMPWIPMRLNNWTERLPPKRLDLALQTISCSKIGIP